MQIDTTLPLLLGCCYRHNLMLGTMRGPARFVRQTHGPAVPEPAFAALRLLKGARLTVKEPILISDPACVR